MTLIRFNEDGWFTPGKVEIDGKEITLAVDATPNFRRGLQTGQGVGIVEHYTAHRNAHGSQSWLDDTRARASAHFVVGDADEPVIWQAVSLNDQAWHAGDGLWDGRNPNRFCWGIEHSCAGLLTQRGHVYQTWYKAEIPAAEVVFGKDHHGNEQAWDDYDELTIAMSIKLHAGLADYRERKGWKWRGCRAHSDVAPSLKWDTGPDFPMAAMNAIMGGRKEPEAQPNPFGAILNVLRSIF